MRVEARGGAVRPAAVAWRRLRANRGALAGLVVVVAAALVALFADALAPHSPVEQFRDHILQPPAWADGGSWRFVLGTDDIGRDVLSRLIHGARVSLSVGVAVVALAFAAGFLIGAAAAMAGGIVDSALMRAMDALLSLPGLLLAVAAAAALGPGLFNAMLAVAVAMTPHMARVTRAVMLAELAQPYVLASRAAGAGPVRLAALTVLPNCAGPLAAQATLGVSTAILDAAVLGFLGLGAQPPTPEWGTMLSSSLQFLQTAPWVVTWPGLAILATALAFNLLGDGLRDALDPRLGR